MIPVTRRVARHHASSVWMAQAPVYGRIVFETGRMAPMLYHGLSQLGLPIFLYREPTG